VVDVDPERTRRDLIGKTRESIGQLEQAQQASEQDVRNASVGILKDLKRFQAEKEDDLRRYMVSVYLLSQGAQLTFLACIRQESDRVGKEE
jgi:hypothetical protein